MACIDLQITHFAKAVECDYFLAIGYLQKGVSHLMLGEYENAIKSWEDGIETMKNTDYVDYGAIHLSYILGKSELMMNMAIGYYHLGKMDMAKKYIEDGMAMGPLCRNTRV